MEQLMKANSMNSGTVEETVENVENKKTTTRAKKSTN